MSSPNSRPRSWRRRSSLMLALGALPVSTAAPLVNTKTTTVVVTSPTTTTFTQPTTVVQTTTVTQPTTVFKTTTAAAANKTSTTTATVITPVTTTVQPSAATVTQTVTEDETTTVYQTTTVSTGGTQATSAPSTAPSSAPSSDTSACACGYVDDQKRVWREAVLSNFASGEGALGVVGDNWNVQTWFGQGRALGQQRTASNVIENNGALGLVTSAYDGSGVVYTGQINTQRQDILYGSFRMRGAVPTEPGVVMGFFTYADPSADESDIEFLSSDPARSTTAHYTNQPAVARNVTLPGDLTQFNEHRIDWLPTSNNFYFNQKLSQSIGYDVPTHPSMIIANVWSDGGVWSQGPPAQEAVGTIEYINLYFNSTSLDEAAFNSQCAAAGSYAACPV